MKPRSSTVIVRRSTRSSALNPSRRKRLIVSSGPSRLSGPITQLTREPSGSRASASGLASRSAVLVGEINEEPIEGFDLTNSPSLILAGGRALFEGRTVVHRTTSGVTGALTALGVTALISLWQENASGIRAVQHFGVAVLRSGAVSSLTLAGSP